MKKAIFFVLVFLTMSLVLSSCDDNYVIDETKTVINQELYNDIEKIQSLKEDPTLLESKNEFLRLFKENAGFSLPSSFVYPPRTNENTWAYATEHKDASFLVLTHFVAEKNDALKMMDFVKNDSSWRGYLYREDVTEGEKQKDKRNCTFFEKGYEYYIAKSNFIKLNFHYDKKTDAYIVFLFASLCYKPYYIEKEDGSYEENPLWSAEDYYGRPNGAIIN